MKSCINGPLRKSRLCKWVTPKMQEIIKQEGSSRQLFKTVNFAFMKIFDFLIKTAIFQVILLFLEICVMRYGQNRTRDLGKNSRHKSPKKSRKAPKKAVLIKKSKIFIKAKFTVSKSCLLGPACFMICCILGDSHLQKVKNSKSQS